MFESIICPICRQQSCPGHTWAPPVYEYQKQQEYKKLIDGIGLGILPSQIGIDRSIVSAFLKYKGWKEHLTSDHKQYWSLNSGQLMTIESAFNNQIKAEVPHVKPNMVV